MVSKRITYPRPIKAYDKVPSPVRPENILIPVSRPPSQSPPRLPTRPSLPAPPSGWTSTSHIIPAAYPRRWRATTGKLNRESDPFQTRPAKENESKEEREGRALEETEACARARYAAAEESTQGNDKQPGLWMAAERWRRDQAGEGLTLVFKHANGFTKEVHLSHRRFRCPETDSGQSWHPTLRRLLTRGDPSSSSTFGESPFDSLPEGIPSGISDIWLLDDIHHAASIDLNAGMIGPIHNWSDEGRDVLNFVEHVLPGVEDGCGVVLTWREADRGGRKKKVIGVGHSVGGTAFVHAAEARPDLFHALFLVEPMCPPVFVDTPNPTKEDLHRHWKMPYTTFKRRDRWPSVEAASSVRASPFFAKWHEESFHIWKTHHLVPHPESGVQLATPVWAEAAIFAEPTGLGEGWDKLTSLGVPTGFFMSGGKAGWTRGEEVTRSLVWRPKNGRNERSEMDSHLLVQEAPDELADALWRFLGVMASSNDTNRPVRAKL